MNDDLLRQFETVAKTSWQEAGFEDPAFEKAQAEYDEEMKAAAYRADAKATFRRAAGLQKMYLDTLIEEGLPMPAAIACLTGFSQEHWGNFYRKD